MSNLHIQKYVYIISGIIIGLFVGIMIIIESPSFYSTSTNDPTTHNTPTAIVDVGSKAPLFSQTNVISGSIIDISKHQGTPIVINFWATWCEPCKEELPHLEEVHSRYTPNNLLVIGVNNGEDVNTVKAFANEYKITFPIIIDANLTIQHNYKIRGYPSTIFVDKNGYITKMHVGMMSAQEILTAVSNMIDY